MSSSNGSQRLLFSAVVFIVALFALMWCMPVRWAYAQGSGTSQDDPYYMDEFRNNVNPFPDRISDEQVAEYVAARSVNGYSPMYLCDVFVADAVLKDGTVVEIYNDLTDVWKIDFLQKHWGEISQIKWYLVLPKSTDGWDSMAYTFVNDLSLTSNVLDNAESNRLNKNLEMSEYKVNGQDMPTSVVFYEWKNGVKANNYFQGTFDVREDNPLWLRILSYPVLGSNSAPLSGSTDMVVFQSEMITNVTMSYVDETEYRKTNGLTFTDAITQRSAGDDWASTAPGASLNLRDLKDSLHFSDKFDGRQFFFAGTPLIPYFSRPDKIYNNHYFNADGTEVEEGEARPTYDEAKASGPAGYVYVGDDIDLPQDYNNPESFNGYTGAAKGNYYFTPILHPDGTMTYDKYYYMVYRQEPAPVSVLKMGADKQPLANVTFDLKRVDADGTQTLVAQKLTTDKNGRLFATSTTEVDAGGLADFTLSDAYDPELGIGQLDGVTYLKPGTYQLQETSVPEGYSKKTFDFTVKDVPSMTTEDKLALQDFTFVNELAPATEPETEPEPQTTPATSPATNPEAGGGKTSDAKSKPVEQKHAVSTKVVPRTGDSNNFAAFGVLAVGAALVTGAVYLRKRQVLLGR